MSCIQKEEGDYFHVNFLQLPKQKGNNYESQMWSQKFKILEVGLMEERLRVIMSML